MYRVALLFVGMPAVFGSPVGAQSFVGDTFQYEASGSNLNDVSDSAVVGPGPEFTIQSTLGSVWTVDIDATSITVTLTESSLGNPRWGGGDQPGSIGALRITDLTYTNGDTIADVTVSGTAGSLSRSDVAFATDTVSIGDTANDFIDWSFGETVRVDATPDDCLGPDVINARTEEIFDTIGAAVAVSNPGDVLELAPCTFFERGIVLDNKDITIRGQGPEHTIIDGESTSPRILTITGGDESTIEGVTMRNGQSDTSDPTAEAGAISSTQFDISEDSNSTIIRDCRFIGNMGDFVSAIRMVNASMLLEQCVFTDNENTGLNGKTIDLASRSELTAIGCVFDSDGRLGEQVIVTGDRPDELNDRRSFATFVNCTFGDADATRHIRVFDESVVRVANSVFSDQPSQAFESVRGGGVEVERSVFVGAMGDNIDGAPTFLDRAGGDFRLASGSLGIDAGDADAYVDAGGVLRDLAGRDRTVDDIGMADTGTGVISFLDAGAYEFQGTSVSGEAFDVNGDGMIDVFDLIEFVEGLEALHP